MCGRGVPEIVKAALDASPLLCSFPGFFQRADWLRHVSLIWSVFAVLLCRPEKVLRLAIWKVQTPSSEHCMGTSIHWHYAIRSGFSFALPDAQGALSKVDLQPTQHEQLRASEAGRERKDDD